MENPKKQTHIYPFMYPIVPKCIQKWAQTHSLTAREALQQSGPKQSQQKQRDKDDDKVHHGAVACGKLFSGPIEREFRVEFSNEK